MLLNQHRQTSAPLPRLSASFDPQWAISAAAAGPAAANRRSAERRAGDRALQTGAACSRSAPAESPSIRPNGAPPIGRRSPAAAAAPMNGTARAQSANGSHVQRRDTPVTDTQSERPATAAEPGRIGPLGQLPRRRLVSPSVYRDIRPGYPQHLLGYPRHLPRLSQTLVPVIPDTCLGYPRHLSRLSPSRVTHVSVISDICPGYLRHLSVPVIPDFCPGYP